MYKLLMQFFHLCTSKNTADKASEESTRSMRFIQYNLQSGVQLKILNNYEGLADVKLRILKGSQYRKSHLRPVLMNMGFFC